MALIFTTEGDLEESLLTKTEGGSENDNEIISWQRWTLNGEIVKENASIHFKQGISMTPVASF